MAGIIGWKLEMTRIIKESAFIPVTLVKVPALKIVQIKTIENDGYSAVVLGASVGKRTILRELPATGKFSEMKLGDDVTLDILEGILTVSVRGVTKGKGFAGVMKRHNFAGGPKTHGSKFHRAIGSIGCRKPRRTKPGQRMHGHMGTDTLTLKNVPLELVNRNLNVIGLKGPLPGARNSLVVLDF